MGLLLPCQNMSWLLHDSHDWPFTEPGLLPVAEVKEVMKQLLQAQSPAIARLLIKTFEVEALAELHARYCIHKEGYATDTFGSLYTSHRQNLGRVWARRFIRNGRLTPKARGWHEKRWGPHRSSLIRLPQTVEYITGTNYRIWFDNAKHNVIFDSQYDRYFI